jgi:hypothetical protein
MSAWLPMLNGLRMRTLLALLLAGLLVAPNVSAEQKSSTGKSSSSSSASKDSGSADSHKKSGAKKSTTTKTKSPAAHRASYCTSCARDAHGRILRAEAAKRAFMRQTGFPHGRPGYVIDHIFPLACGGADNTSNMQWQTIAASKAKDKIERKGCGSR